MADEFSKKIDNHRYDTDDHWVRLHLGLAKIFDPLVSFVLLVRTPTKLVLVPRYRQPLIFVVGMAYLSAFVWTDIPANIGNYLKVFGERPASTLLPALLAAPFAFLIWLWRDQDRRQEIDHKSQEVALAHRREEEDRRGELLRQAQSFEKVEDEMVNLQQFSRFLSGMYGAPLEEEAWQVLAQRIQKAIGKTIKERLDAAHPKTPNNLQSLPSDLRSYFTEIEKCSLPVWYQWFCENTAAQNPILLFRNLPQIDFVSISFAEKLEISRTDLRIRFCIIQNSSLLTLAAGSSFFATGSQFDQCGFTFYSNSKSFANFCFFQDCQFESPIGIKRRKETFQRSFFKGCTFKQTETFNFLDNVFEDCIFNGELPSGTNNLLINCT